MLKNLGVKLPGEKAEKSTAAPNAKDTKPAAKDRGKRRGRPGRHSVKQPNPATKATIFDVKTENGTLRADFNGNCSLYGELGHGRRDCAHKDAAGGVAICIREQPVEEETTLSMGEALIAPSMVKANTLSTCHVISNPGLPNDIHIATRRIRVNGLNVAWFSTSKRLCQEWVS